MTGFFQLRAVLMGLFCRGLFLPVTLVDHDPIDVSKNLNNYAFQFFVGFQKFRLRIDASVPM